MANHYLSTRNEINKYTNMFFIFLHISLGLDFGYVRFASKKINRLITSLTFLYCLCLASFTGAFFQIHNFSTVTKYWTLPGSILFLLIALILMKFKPKSSFFSLQKALMSIDTKLSTRDSYAYNIDVKIILFCVGCIVYKIILNIIFCINNEDDCLTVYFGAIMYTSQMFSFDITMLVSFFIFYSVHLRIKTLSSLVRSNDIDPAYCLDIYRNIVKSINTAKKCFDYLYVVALIIFVPDLIVQFYVNLTKLKTRSSMDYLHSLVVRNLHAIHNFMLLCSPAIGADLVTSAAEELKLLFHDKLLQAKEEEQALSLERFLNYIDGRPLRFTVFKIIPLDWTLPVTIVNLVISYQIIIVQITNLY